jgi:divalent metal cation (Fe/Co/Zn/Cd) transporter
MLHAGIHVTVAPDTRVEDADRIADRVRERVSVVTSCAYCVVQVESAHRTAIGPAPAG